MRKVNDNRGPEGREEMKKAFEFMLGHIGAFFCLRTAGDLLLPSDCS